MDELSKVNALSAYLAEDPVARRYFACLSPNRQRELITTASDLADRNEVAAYVNACMAHEG